MVINIVQEVSHTLAHSNSTKFLLISAGAPVLVQKLWPELPLNYYCFHRYQL